MKGLKKLLVCIMAVLLGLESPIGSSVMSEWGYSVTAEAAGKVALSSRKTSVAVGASKTISLRNASGKVKWIISKKSKRVASIKVNGASVKITGKKAGTATITAKVGKKSYKCKLTVKNAPKISKSSICLTKGSSYGLTVSGTSSSPKWSTSNKKVASIKKISARKYSVRAVSAGKAIIKARVNGKTLQCTVTVKNSTKVTETSSTEPVKKPETEPIKPSTPNETIPAKPSTPNETKPTESETQKPTETETEDQWGSYLENAQMSKSSLDMVVGDVNSLIMSGAYGGIPFVWSSSNSSVVSISKVTSVKYKLTAMSEGSAVVSAKCGSHVYSCRVTVSKKVTPTPPETEPETKPTETPSTEPTTEAPKPNPNPSQPDTEPETETEPETKPQPKLSLSAASKLSAPGGKRIIIIVNTSVSANDITYNLNNVNKVVNGISALDGVLFDKEHKDISFIARLKGEYTVYVSGGGETIEVPVEVTSTDDVWFDYMNKLTKLVKSFPGSSDPLEGLKQLGMWLVDNCPYDRGQGRDHKLLFTGDIGLDCIGYSEVFIDVARRLYGLEADYYPRVGIGHTVAEVIIDGETWRFDAGTDGPVGQRTFSFINESKTYGGGYSKANGGWVTKLGW